MTEEEKEYKRKRELSILVEDAEFFFPFLKGRRERKEAEEKEISLIRRVESLPFIKKLDIEIDFKTGIRRFRMITETGETRVFDISKEMIQIEKEDEIIKMIEHIFK